ncbi:hypothetical protein EAS68_11600 [Legionella jordanis]|uniref:hypothetical protein n=1 Tax=Legionella jordanis TaxID=456 RepID=UPI000EFEE26D|nr:hypothetical protein [Legionella jordanis]RMX15755.1 hypothetical protein EAS68_11600 [Legionella jordanis]
MDYYLINAINYRRSFEADAQSFMLDPAPATVIITPFPDKPEDKAIYLASLQKIVSGRKYKTSILIWNVEPIFLNDILRTIEGNPNIIGLEVAGWFEDEHVALIAELLTEPQCAIAKLRLAFKEELNFLPLAQALQKNKSISQLSFEFLSGLLYPADLQWLSCIFKVMAGNPLDEAEGFESVIANNSVQALELVGFSEISKAAEHHLNSMLEKNQTLTHFRWAGTKPELFTKMKNSLSQSKQLSVLSLEGCVMSSDELANIAHFLPSNLGVLNLSHLADLAHTSKAYREAFVIGLINLINECKAKRLELQIIFHNNDLKCAIEKYRDDLRQLISRESKVYLTTKEMKELVWAHQNQCLTFFNIVSAAKLKADERFESQFNHGVV